MSVRARLAAATLALGLLLPGAAALAQEVTLNVLYNLPGFTRFHQPIAERFEQLHPDIKIHLLAPAPDYNSGHQQILRAAVTGNLPDVFFSGYHLLPELTRNLAPRQQLVDLAPFIQAEGGQAFLDANFMPQMAALGQVKGTQYGLPMNASSPIMFYNADLVRQAGGDPDHMPDTWPELMALAKKIDANGATGLAYDVTVWPDDWLWQALITQAGGTIADPQTGKVAYDNAIGLAAMQQVRAFQADGKQAPLDWDQSRQQFGAGRTGILFSTPAHVQTIEQLVGDRFALRTATFPLDDKQKGGVPTGGNALVILTQDPAKQRAAWEYAKFATGPEAQNLVVRITGYLPTNRRAYGEDFLAPYYREHPNLATAARQADRSRPWAAYGSGDAVRIWRTQRDILGRVGRGDVTPQQGLTELVDATNQLIK